MFNEVPRDDFEYVEDPAPRRPTAMKPRQRRFVPTLRPNPAYDNDSATRMGMRIPMQDYLAQRFEFAGRRNGKSFQLLRAENQRRQNLSIARGNVQLSRTSGDWHPITPGEITSALADLERQRQRETAAA